jgi:ATP-dependent Lhr-like helicase
MATSTEALTGFHPLVRRWFEERVGTPTDVQAQAWRAIGAGRHVLITAPTGSGKTLAAFLWALDRLIRREWRPGQVRVLYVSPLKALNNDIQRNLLGPLAELRGYFARADEALPAIRVLTRSGDTPESERRRMLKYPPEILITTPESLNLFLSARKARPLLTGIETVILDEIHAVAGTKRGTHLITAVDRLVPLSGEFQRVALSATVKPLEAVAEFVGGYEMEFHGEEPLYRRRPVSIVRSESAKEYRLTVRSVPAETRAQGSHWHSLARECRQLIEGSRSTLIFTNSRRLCERICLYINEDAGRTLAYAHHGSLSREARGAVEQRLKTGELAAIVATNSLELGIDIGTLDQVILIETPRSVASAVQRIGRAGHRVGEVSRGVLFPTHGRDFVEAAVVARAVLERDVEAIRPVMAPLDVLAQVLVSMTAMETWDIEELYRFLRTSYPYRNLPREQYDLVLEMLAGRYADARVRALEPLVSLDRIDGTVRGRDYALRLLYASGGTIPDRGYFTMRRHDNRAKIGELDEEFVWERSPGDKFTLGAQAWQIRQITHSDVLVEPARASSGFVPFWRADKQATPFHLAEKTGLFLEWANPRLDEPELREVLVREHGMEPEAADDLVRFLERQRSLTRADLPHRHHLLVEHFTEHLKDAGTPQVVLHTLWGTSLNYPLSLALAQAWEERHGARLEVQANDDAVLVAPPEDVGGRYLLDLVSPETVEGLLRRRLEKTGFFGARFRENAARALLLPRPGFNKRMPLWLNRLRSKRLLDAVLGYPDFPILLETWRTCLQDEFDLENLKRVLGELRDGAIALTEVSTAVPSAFCEGLVWQQTNQFMYMDDTPESGRASNLSADLLQGLMHSPELRPAIPAVIAESFERKAQRVFAGYAPQTSEELLDWVKERLWIPAREWEELRAACERDGRSDRAELLEPVAHKLVLLRAGRTSGVAPLEGLPRLMNAFGSDDFAAEDLNGDAVDFETSAPGDEDAGLVEWLAEWLRFYGPVPRSYLTEVLPVAPERLAEAMDELAEAQDIVTGLLTEDAPAEEICDAQNYEILLRLARLERRPDFQALPAEALPLFLAAHQGLIERGETVDDLQRVLEALFGYPLAADLLEGEVLPARMEGYSPAMLDGLAQESGLLWFGCGERRIALALESNVDLFLQPGSEDGPSLLPDARARYAFSDLLEHTRQSSAELTRALWEQAWQGRITNDTFAALRRGIETKFQAAGHTPGERPSRRAGFQRWKATRPFAGNWYALPAADESADVLEREEDNRDRVRVLLDRYGVLFRELLREELPPLRWPALFRTLRLMELSGEVLSGSFFEGVPGLQFASQAAFRELQTTLPEDAVYWLNADDPASLCGIDLPDLKGALPKRVPGNHLVYHGRRLVLVSRRMGREIDIAVDPHGPNLERYLIVFRELLTRAVRHMPSITVEIVNGEPAPMSPYLEILGRLFDVDADPRRVTLWKKA